MDYPNSRIDRTQEVSNLSLWKVVDLQVLGIDYQTTPQLSVIVSIDCSTLLKHLMLHLCSEYCRSLKMEKFSSVWHTYMRSFSFFHLITEETQYPELSILISFGLALLSFEIYRGNCYGAFLVDEWYMLLFLDIFINLNRNLVGYMISYIDLMSQTTIYQYC